MPIRSPHPSLPGAVQPAWRVRSMKSRLQALVASLFFLAAVPNVPAADPLAVSRPNIVVILADDLGIGDLGSYGATKIKTPNLDRLAAEGIRLTAAHAAAAVCQPSRYALMTGRYYWRSTQAGPSLALYFDEGEVTLPAVLKAAGYRTGAIGKWHLGFTTNKEPDWNGELKPGPLEVGFDSFFGLARSNNEPPFVFIENHRVYRGDPKDPIIMVDQKDLPKGAAYGWGASRGAKAAHAARPDDRIDILLTDKAEEFIESQTPETPFFLYLAYIAPHYPIIPAKEFRGTSGAGDYGDIVQQLDACVGRVLAALEKKGLADNTLVIFSSDNGAVNVGEAHAVGHRSNADSQGQKTDAWDGGHREPFLARWPGRIPAGKTSKELFGLNDIMATSIAAAGLPMPAGAGPDSLNLLPVLEGKTPSPRTEMVYQGVFGLGLRQGPWVYLPAQGSLGFTTTRAFGVPYAKMGFQNNSLDADGKPLPDAPPDQLYNIEEDPAQQNNVVTQHPEVASRMAARLVEITGPNPPRIVGSPKKAKKQP